MSRRSPAPTTEGAVISGAPPAAVPKNEPLRVVNAAQLLGDCSAVALRLGNTDYVLRRTRSGKLILTK
jgi:hemin uptake protein HemP